MTPLPLTVTIDDIIDHHDGARLSGRSTIGGVVIVVSARPDLAGARRWAAAVRRVDRVELQLERGSTVRCRARGKSSRLPFARSVPLAIGLGLGLLGVPVVVSGLER